MAKCGVLCVKSCNHLLLAGMWCHAKQGTQDYTRPCRCTFRRRFGRASETYPAVLRWRSCAPVVMSALRARLYTFHERAASAPRHVTSAPIHFTSAPRHVTSALRARQDTSRARWERANAWHERPASARYYIW